MSAEDEGRARREHLRRRAPRRRLAPDRLAGAQRPAERAAGDPRARRAGDRAAALQPVPRGARARHPPHPHDRARHARRLGLRPDLDRDALQLRRARRALQRRDGERARRRRRRRSARSSRACCASGSTRSCSSSSTSACSRWCAASTSASRSSPRRPPPGAARSSSRSTSTAARASAVRHLAELGHTRILHLAGPANARPTRSSGSAAGATSSPRTGSRSSSRRTATGRRRAATALGSELDVEPGLGDLRRATTTCRSALLSALRERGLRVPEDVSVVGFDDVPEAGYLFPPLTTVRQDFAALGELIMQKVLIAVEEPDSRHRGHPAADAPDRAAVDAGADRQG